MSYKNLNNNIPEIVYYCESRYSSSSNGFTIIKVADSSAALINPMEMVMDYMQKRIDQIDQTRRELRMKYPNLLPATL